MDQIKTQRSSVVGLVVEPARGLYLPARLRSGTRKCGTHHHLGVDVVNVSLLNETQEGIGYGSRRLYSIYPLHTGMAELRLVGVPQTLHRRVVVTIRHSYQCFR